MFFCEYIYVKIFFRCFILCKYVFTDILQNRCSWKFCKVHRKTPVPDSLNSNTDVSQRIFRTFKEHSCYRTSPNGCFWFKFNRLTVLRRFCFRTDQYLFNIPSYFRVYQNSWLPDSWDPIRFLHRINTVRVEITPVLKRSWYLFHKVY